MQYKNVKSRHFDHLLAWLPHLCPLQFQQLILQTDRAKAPAAHNSEKSGPRHLRVESQKQRHPKLECAPSNFQPESYYLETAAVEITSVTEETEEQVSSQNDMILRLLSCKLPEIETNVIHQP